MFVTSEPFLPLEHLRIPHRVDPAGAEESASVHGVPMGFASLSVDGAMGGPRLYWPLAGSPLLAGASLGRHTLRGIPLFARAADPAALADALPAGWRVAAHEEGELAAVRHDDGSIVLPFDPGEAMECLWSERYLTMGGRLGITSAARWLYYRLRPLMPRRLQIELRRSYARVQGRRPFPAWPMETALHDLLREVYWLLTELAGGPVPWIAPWPAPYRWAVVLTHDVEQPAGQAQIGVMRDAERALGFRSSWNFPARRYVVDESVVASLREEGCEIGVHGALHDGRDLESLRTIDERLPAMREVAARWGAVGFRSPATHRRWEWMPRLGFAYDSSSPDTDPYEPQPGGCCSWWPFFNDSMVELPITMPQDHTLFTILRTDETVWLDKARALRDRSGMALVLTHPDYLGTAAAAEPYQRALTSFAADPTAWRALPREVADWWRRRAASSIERQADGWRVTGPAADEAAICLGAP
ncbi:MAG TPA: hypothetical protein VFK61_02875 [Candidatus Limnocylindria bacterium]|nr:hypothetical protein [Candidatus Limnocylindria bacterium]